MLFADNSSECEASTEASGAKNEPAVVFRGVRGVSFKGSNPVGKREMGRGSGRFLRPWPGVDVCKILASHQFGIALTDRSTLRITISDSLQCLGWVVGMTYGNS